MASFHDAQYAVHKLAKQKGWWSKKRSDAELIALMHSELSEALEEIRNDRPALYQVRAGKVMEYDPKTWLSDVKPEGTLIELADCVIRILDMCGKKKWDLGQAIAIKHVYNKTRSFRHGGKKL